MYYRMIRNDIAKSKAITMTTMLFVAAAAMLVSLAAILVVNLFGSIDALMTQARTPHFMQMHAGAVDTARLTAFAKQNTNVDQFQVVEFLNVDGAQINFGDKSLAESIQDNGFSTQNKRFDYLFDLDGKVINVSDGELYVPICYLKDNTTKVGDKAVVGSKEFTVAGFVRDSQMNPALSSSKRFLVSENDYAAIKSLGRLEYLIEFRLKDLSALGTFENAYTAAGLEANGPTITYPLFKMLNAMSDGLMIAVMLLVSALVVAIAFMCIRFTLLAKIEDDYREIGVMKAIGLRVGDIKRIYLAKYAAVAAVGCVLGFALSFVFRGALLANIRLYMGESGNPLLASFLGLAGTLLIFLAVVSYVSGVLKRFRKISAAEAVRFGTAQERAAGAKRFRLSRSNRLNTNLFLGVKDVLARKGLYGTMLAVLVLSAFIMIVPQNLNSTIASDSFIRYMGIGNYDIRIDLQQTDHLAQKAAEIERTIKSDQAVAKFAVLATKTFNARMADGTEEQLHVELGDHAVFPVKYATGRAPAAADEIALSAINADALGKKVGDVITLVVGGQAKNVTVCGIYSDITNGGKTAKAVFTDDAAAPMRYVISAQLADESLVGAKVSEYADRFSFGKVSDVDAFMAQTYGSTIGSVRTASYAAIAVALMMAGLVTLLFMKMLVAKDRYSIAVTKALGFTNSDITVQYVARSVFVLVVGIVVGTLLANTLGEVLAGMMISQLGASSFAFVVNPLSAYLLCPLAMVCAVLVATTAGTATAGRIKISENIKE